MSSGDYAWGSTTAIAGLLGRPESGGPEAELWIGAHPDSPSVAPAVRDGTTDAAGRADRRGPGAFPGRGSVAAFGPRLPFLAKILAAAQPLSPAGPPQPGAGQGRFAREKADGVAPDAPHRNYRDDNHKPEMIFALTAVRGALRLPAAGDSPDVLLHLAGCLDLVGTEVPGTVLTDCMRGPVAAPMRTPALRAAFERLIAGGEDVSRRHRRRWPPALISGAPLAPYQAELSTVVSLNEKYPGDPGVLISLLLNRLSLAPGRGRLPAGRQCPRLPARPGRGGHGFLGQRAPRRADTEVR